MEAVPVRSCWQSRPETPEELAQRLRILLRLLRPIAPLYQQWFQVIDERTFRLVDDNDDWLDANIAANVSTDELRQPSPYFGYNSRTMSTTPDKIRPGAVCIHMDGGGQYINSCCIRALGRAAPDPAYVTYPILRRTVLAVSQAFEPDWCDAGPYSLWRGMKMSDYARGPVITPCWMIYLSPVLAQKLTPPAGVISERFADGSLFMSVTDKCFDPEDRGHVEGAQRMFAVLDTLQEKLPREQWRR